MYELTHSIGASPYVSTSFMGVPSCLGLCVITTFFNLSHSLFETGQFLLPGTVGNANANIWFTLCLHVCIQGYNKGQFEIY